MTTPGRRDATPTLRERLRRDNGQAVGLVLVLVLLGGAAFGTGWKATGDVLLSGGTWLAKGDSAVHVNGGTGQVDAEVRDELLAQARAAGGTGVGIVPGPDGGMYAVDPQAGTVTVVDGATAAASEPVEAGTGVEVLAGGARAGDPVYLVDHEGGTVQPVDPVTLRPTGDPVLRADGGVGAAVVDGEGRVWAVSPGQQQVVAAGADAEPVRAGADAVLTSVGGRVVVVDLARDRVVVVEGGDRREHRVELRDDDRVAQPAEGDLLWLARPSTGEVLGVDVRTGEVRTAATGAGAGDLGRPVVHGGSVYVPDLGARVVRAVSADGSRAPREVQVPGRSDDFTLTLSGGYVWANDAQARRATALDVAGNQTTVDKGPGEGLVDEEAERAAAREAAAEQAARAEQARREA
ncbi:NHL repeat-containing protein, partial [Angustibacter speluncae]